MYIDTHAHLNDSAYLDDLEEVIASSMANEVKGFIVVGFNKETNKRAIELAHKYPFIYATVGIHPSDVNEYNEENKNLILKQLEDPKVVGIGECGLDYYWHQDNKELQKEVFRWQIETSKKLDIPIIIHMRDASLDTLNILKEYDNVKGIMHGYSGSAEMLEDFYKIGLHIAIGGVVTFKNAKVIKEVARVARMDRLVLETDCPYLTPHPYRGKRNSPEYIPLIAKEIALLKDISISDIRDITYKNVLKLFDLEGKLWKNY